MHITNTCTPQYLKKESSNTRRIINIRIVCVLYANYSTTMHSRQYILSLFLSVSFSSILLQVSESGEGAHDINNRTQQYSTMSNVGAITNMAANGRPRYRLALITLKNSMIKNYQSWRMTMKIILEQYNFVKYCRRNRRMSQH